MKSILILFSMLLFTITMSAQSAWKAPKSANILVNSEKIMKSAVTNGKAIYKQQCMMCHGVKGKGDGAAGAYFNPRPANFTSVKIQNQTDGSFFWKITNGNSPMPSFKDILTKKQRWDIINYLRTFKQ